MSRAAEIRKETTPFIPFHTDEVRRAFIASFKAAEHKTHPFPHLFVENVFPPAFYAALIEHLPHDTEYEAMTKKRTPNRLAHLYRLTYDLSNDCYKLNDSVRPYWEIVLATIDSPEFASALSEKFSEPLRQRYGRNELEMKIRLQLLRDSTGFAIGPHTDAVSKVFTCLFYLPPDHSQKLLGTSIFVPKQRGFVDESGKQLKFEPFEEFARMPFIPNSLFIFMKTDNSFHGRYTVPEGSAARNIINCSVRLAKKGAAAQTDDEDYATDGNAEGQRGMRIFSPLKKFMRKYLAS
jgi:hypothetical protein